MAEHQQAQKSTESKYNIQTRTIPPKQISILNPMAIIQRARINPKSLTHADVMQLQRTIGNRAVGILLSEIGLVPSKVALAPPVQMQKMPEEEEPLQGKMIETIQRQEIPEPEEEEPLQGKFESNPELETCPSCSPTPIPLEKENCTGMPDNLRAGVENLSGIDMSDVRVHYNSSKPVEVGALAYTQGTDIHVAPGQEQHLPHEAWHVVQQAQGRVKPNMQLKDLAVNDDEGLEREADIFGAKAIQIRYNRTKESQELAGNLKLAHAPIQCLMKKLGLDKEEYKKKLMSTVFLYAEYNGNPFGVNNGIFHTTSSKHAEENLSSAIKKAGLNGGVLNVWLSTSPCSSDFGTRCDSELGCQERLEKLLTDYGIKINVFADHLYQKQDVGIMERENGFPTAFSSYSSAVSSRFPIMVSHLPHALDDGESLKDTVTDGSVAQFKKNECLGSEKKTPR